MIKRIIFDIDGTLITNVNFKPYIAETLISYGVKDLKKINLFIENIKKYEEKYASYDKDKYLEYFSSVLDIKLDIDFLNIFWNNLRYAIPKNSLEIKNVLDSLNDYELVLLSNYFEESQRNRLKEMGINDYFIEYYGEKIVKPQKKVYYDAAGKYTPKECVIIGDDKINDIDVPKSLGFNTIYINNDNGDIKNITEISKQLIKKFDNI